jgi:neutral ceramidase
MNHPAFLDRGRRNRLPHPCKHWTSTRWRGALWARFRLRGAIFSQLLTLLILCAAGLYGAEMKAGVAKVEITPTTPVWMSGYSARTHPSEGVLIPLWAKALALESSRGRRIVIVSTDVVGIPRGVADEVAARVHTQYGLERSELLINCSHTHTGPMIWPNLMNLTVISPEEERKLIAYSHTFADALVTVVGEALHDLAPATVSYGEGSAAFAMNRRLPTPTGVKNSPYPEGPVDHRVPVLKIVDRSGKIRAILFAYACHNTTLGGDIYQFSGDYAGYAQAALEKEHPGATALFMILCGADQNPYPRGTVAHAQLHGDELAEAVDRVVSGSMTPVSAPIASTFRLIQLRLAPRSRDDFEKELKSPIPAVVRRAELMLKAMDAGRPIDQVEYPVEAVRFGHSLTLLALGGEVTVDYALRMQREYHGEPVITAGYSNDVMSYIPSARVLREGGYEAVDSMPYYGLAGPYSADVEDRIFAAIHQVMAKLGRKVGF